MKRTVFWKRMTALALAAILLLGLLPAAAFGAEPSDEPVQTKYVYEETDGICRAVREEDALPEKPAAQSAGASAQSSGKLATPTNLRWEKEPKIYGGAQRSYLSARGLSQLHQLGRCKKFRNKL